MSDDKSNDRNNAGTTPSGSKGKGGEGNVEADRHYREATEKFVKDDRVDRAAREAADESEEQLREDRDAEEKGKSRARE